jgi:outer membrane receptor protein involved in Fe transport
MSERKVPWAIAAVLTVFGWLLLAVRPSHAQVHLGTIPVEAERSREGRLGPAEPAQDDAPFVTVIDATEPGARVASVAELVEGQAGVRVRSRGGLGAFTSLSIRGADSGQVAVYLDGVPLNRALGSAVDLAQLPVEGLERVEIYRGVPPIELGADAIGGAIHLVSRRGARRRGASWRAAVGGGSFAARSASLGYSRTEPGMTLDLSAAYHGARGDFRYYDNQGTLLDRSDDFFSRRRNAGFDQVAIDATVQSTGRGVGQGSLRWNLGSHGFFKRQGVPGPGTAGAESRTAKLDTGRLVFEGGVALPRWRKGGDARVDAHVLLERVAFDNLSDERVGSYSPSRTEGQTLAFGFEPRIDAPLGRHQLLSVYSELRVERYQANDLLNLPSKRPVSLRTRVATAVVDELRFLDDRLALSPALRFDGIDSQLADAVGVLGGQAKGGSRREVFLSPRLGVRWRVSEGLWFKGNVGRFVRLPSLIELFGDQAFILPSPSLQPEVAVGGDAGLGLALGARRTQRGLGLMLEAAFFGRRVADTIVFLPRARALAACNLGFSRALGAELRAEAHWGRALRFTVEYTFLDPRNQNSEPGVASPGSCSREPGVAGKQLPGRARHELSAKLHLSRGPVAGFYGVDFLDRVFRDPQNFNAIPARWLHAVGITLGPFARWPLTLGVEVRNLFDLRVVDMPLGGSANAGRTTPYPLVDFFDYSLPGRAIYATLALRR